MSGVVYWLDMAGVIVFALSGVILACRSRMDPIGMLVLASVTGIGGGTLRDLVSVSYTHLTLPTILRV